jgi:hypothetical protein
MPFKHSLSDSKDIAMPYHYSAGSLGTPAGRETRTESRWERIWSAAEGVRDCIARRLIDGGLHDAHAYIIERRTTCPEPAVFTFAAIAGATHASIKINASQIERNTDEVALFALLVAQCLYQGLESV